MAIYRHLRALYVVTRTGIELIPSLSAAFSKMRKRL